MDRRSLIQRLVAKYGAQGFYERLSPEERSALPWSWEAWGRPEQLWPEGRWTVWLYLGGRGAGKSRTGAEFLRECNRRMPGSRGALIAQTPADARDVMIEGESGILAKSPPRERPLYEPSKRRLTWPLIKDAPTVATIFSAHEHDQLRGPQFHWAWGDEIAKWTDPSAAWANLMFAVRLDYPGETLRVFASTTPRPIKLVRDLLKRPSTVVSRGSTYDNRANLAAAFYTEIITAYEGTRLGRQELMGEVLDDTPGAMWTRAMFDADGFRLSRAPELERIVVAIDPAVTSGDDADLTGIIAAGRHWGADDRRRFCVLDDRSLIASPNDWAAKAVSLFYARNADRIVAEANNGGEMVEAVIRTVDPTVPVKLVHASRGKHVRAEPIAALYEQGRVHHVGDFDDLEDQLVMMTTDGYAGGGSPDRADALVWALTELNGKSPVLV